MDENLAQAFLRIQEDALDSTVPLADTLRRCLALGGRLKSQELISWASAELNGYADTTSIPEYRRIKASLLMDYVNGPTHATGQEVTASLLDEDRWASMYDVELREPLHLLERHASHDAGGALSIQPADGGLLKAMITRNAKDSSFLGVLSVYWRVPLASLGAVVDQVRTKLVTMVATFELAAAKPGTTESAAARQAISVVANPGSTVTVNTTSNGDIATGSGEAQVTTTRAGRDADSSVSGDTELDADSAVPETKRWTGLKVVVSALATGLALWFAYLAIPAGG